MGTSVSAIVTAFRYAVLCHTQALDAELAEPGRAALCSNQALANSLWSYATLRYYPLQFLPQFCREVGRQEGQVSAPSSVPFISETIQEMAL